MRAELCAAREFEAQSQCHVDAIKKSLQFSLHGRIVNYCFNGLEEEEEEEQREAKELQVEVVAGRAMPKMDPGPFGKCDPYIKLLCGSIEHKTQVEKRTFDPTWHEVFRVAIGTEDTRVLTVECYDYDMLDENDFIGSVEIRTQDIHDKCAGWYTLVHRDCPQFQAQVFLSLTPIYDSSEAAP